MLKIFSGKKEKKGASSDAEAGKAPENNESQNTTNASPTLAVGEHAKEAPKAEADTSSGSGFDRDSSYSGVSSDAADYIPRDGGKSAPLRPGSTQLSTVGSTSKPAGPDLPDVVLPAVRYVYDPNTARWGTQFVRLRIRHPNRGISQDDFHVYFACDLQLLKDYPVRQPAAGSAGAKCTFGGSVEGAREAERRANEEREWTRTGHSLSPEAIYKVIPMVSRMYRHNIKDVMDSDYFGAGQAQAVTEMLVAKFRQLPIASGTIRLPLPLLTNRSVCRIDMANLSPDLQIQHKGFFSYTTSDSRDIMMLLEPDVRECGALGISFSLRMPTTAQSGADANICPGGSADTNRSNSVNVATGDERKVREDDVYPPFDSSRYTKAELKMVAEAFSHYSYQENKGALLVHGLLSSHHYLVDPLVYTKDRKGFGMANEGPRAIARWERRHQCNDLCRAYGLKPVVLQSQNPEDGGRPAGAPNEADKKDSKEKEDKKRAEKDEKKRAKEEKKRLEKEKKRQEKEEKKARKSA